MNKKLNKRAQVWAIDLSIAFVLFVGVIFLFYRYSISFAPEDPLVNKIIKEGNYASNTLLSTGYPETWNYNESPSDIYAIGLLNKDGMLNISKVEKFRNWASDRTSLGYYNESKKRINTQFEYYIEFNPGPEGPYIEPIGWQYSNAKQIVRIQRLVPYKYLPEGSEEVIIPVKLTLYLWTNKAA